MCEHACMLQCIHAHPKFCFFVLSRGCDVYTFFGRPMFEARLLLSPQNAPSLSPYCTWILGKR